jgi:gas vesicle protein
MNNTLKIITGSVIGAGVGLLTGYLTAPRSGKRSRKMIVDEYNTQTKAIEDAATNKLEDAKTILQESLEKNKKYGSKIIDKMKGTVSNQV